MDLDDAYEQIYGRGTGSWTIRCTFLLALQSMSLALESNVSPFVAGCTAELGITTPVQKANMNSAASLGMLLGTILLVPLADVVGRWRLLFWSSLGTAAFAFLSAAVQSYYQLLITRALVGFMAAGWPVAVDLLEEYVTPEKRGFLSSMVNVGWSVGAVAINLLAWMVIPSFGWRGLLLFTAIAYSINVLLLLLLVESPRWLLSMGRHQEAMDAIAFVANANGTVVPCTRLKAISDEASPLSASYTKSFMQVFQGMASLLSVENARMTLCVWGVWAAWNMAYQSVVIIDDTLLGASHGSCSFNYGSIAILSTSEILGAVLIMPLVDRKDLGWWGGRLGMQAIPYVIAAAASALCGFQVLSVPFWAFLTRAAMSGGSGCSVLHLPELYKTKCRATGTSAANLFGMLGAIAAPYAVYSGTDGEFLRSCLLVSLVLLIATALLVGIPEKAQAHLDGKEDTGKHEI